MLVNSTEKCNTELTYGGEKLGTVKLQRDSKEIVSHHFYLRLHMNVVTFGEGKAGHQFWDVQGKVNQLLFIDDLKLYSQNEKKIDKTVNKVQIFIEEIRIEFLISAQHLKWRGAISTSTGIQLTNNEVIKNGEGRWRRK